MNELSGGCICYKPEREIAYVLPWCADGVEKTEEGGTGCSGAAKVARLSS